MAHESIWIIVRPRIFMQIYTFMDVIEKKK